MASIQGVYVALFGRPADPIGLSYFNGVTRNGSDLAGIGDLASTEEYKIRFAGKSNNEIINSIYQSLFGRDAEPGGIAFFVDALAKGTLNIKNIAIAILDGAQNNDKTVVNTKIAAADAYTKALDTPAEVGAYSGTAASAAGIAFLKTVTMAVPDTAAVNAAVLVMANAGAAGNTLTAVIGTDNFTVGSGANNTTDKSDIINAQITSGAGTNLASDDAWVWANDKVDGGFGTDTLNVTIDASGTVAADGLKSVEILNVKGTVTGIVLDVAQAKDLTQIWSDNSSNLGFNNRGPEGLTINNIALTTAIGVKGLSESSILTFNYANATGNADAATLSLDSETGSSIKVTGIETLNIVNQGTSSFSSFVIPNAKTINITGTGSLKDTSFHGNVETITNNLNGTMSANVQSAQFLTSYTGNALTDNVTASNSGLKANLTIDTGAGNDTFEITGSSHSGFSMTLKGGAGSDVFYLGLKGFIPGPLTNVDSVASSSDLAKSLIIVSDFERNADTINVKGNYVGLGTGQAGNVAGQANLLAAAQAAANFIGTLQATTFSFGGDSYLFINNQNAGLDVGDGLVKVTGVALTDFTAGNLTWA